MSKLLSSYPNPDLYSPPYTMNSKVDIFDHQEYPNAEYGYLAPLPLNIIPSPPSSVEYYPNPVAHSPENASLMLSPPSAPSTLVSNNSISEKIIANAASIPEPFLLEVHQYSKEIYERRSFQNKKRRRTSDEDDSSDVDDDGDVDQEAAAETRRQIHIQSEQKRRAQIKDGFDDLRKQLPGCLNKKISKAALLNRTVHHIQHLKSVQTNLLAELERLMNENEQLKKFQESVLQKQALEKMYQMGPM